MYMCFDIFTENRTVSLFTFQILTKRLIVDVWYSMNICIKLNNDDDELTLYDTQLITIHQSFFLVIGQMLVIHSRGLRRPFP